MNINLFYLLVFRENYFETSSVPTMKKVREASHYAL